MPLRVEERLRGEYLSGLVEAHPFAWERAHGFMWPIWRKQHQVASSPGFDIEWFVVYKYVYHVGRGNVAVEHMQMEEAAPGVHKPKVGAI